MARARIEEVEEALNDGNCAFNAFALALCSETILTKIQASVLGRGATPDLEWHHFIKLAAAALSVAENWEAVKKAMLERREKNKYAFQKQIARVMRTLAHDLAKSHVANEYMYYYEKADIAFTAAYINFDPDDEASKDDIFCAHQFIETKFKEYKANNTDMESILKWWKAEGYESFLDAMNENAVHAGDLELARLARYFKVTLMRLDGPDIYRNFGYFPNLTLSQHEAIAEPVRKQIMIALTNRGIIDQFTTEPECGYKFNLGSMAEIHPRIVRMRDYDLVVDFIKSQPKDILGVPVPSDWPPECVSQLIQRNVIGRLADNSGYAFSRDTVKALRTIDEVPEITRVISLCSDHLENHPELMLKHKFISSGHKKIGHWDNVKIKAKSCLLPISMLGFFNNNDRLFGGTVAAQYVYLTCMKKSNK